MSVLESFEGESVAFAMPWRKVTRRTIGVGSGAAANLRRSNSICVPCRSVKDRADDVIVAQW